MTATRHLLTLASALLLVLAVPAAAQAGNLTGKVVDADSGDGIAALTVKAKAPQDAGGGESATTTGADGTYRLPKLADGRYLLTVSRGRDLLFREVVEVKGETTKTVRLKRG